MNKLALISHPDCLLHEMGSLHPECPDRIRAIADELKRTGLISKLNSYSAPMATREQLLRVHDVEYIDSIFANAPKNGMLALDPDTSMNPHSLTAALHAAGAVILGVDLVLSREMNSAFCNIRPPGHHAEKNKAIGFCLFNNVALGAAHALSHHHLKRVAIIDFDVHHGNGIEDIFQADDRVLYCSSFQSPFYPFTGEDTQSNHIINLPLPAGTDGKTYRELVTNHWLKQIAHFEPEMIFFSAGFDAYYLDDMSEVLLKEDDYAWITREIKQIAEQVCAGRIVSALEGGYELKGLGRSAAAHIGALL